MRKRYPDAGSPQGGVVSPILANAYLHEVLDTWFARVVRSRLKGRAFLIRYADDAVMVFSEESDARRVLAVLPKRFGKYGLTLHPEKTRLVCFHRPRHGVGKGDGQRPQPDTFDLLGFTHYWGRSRKGNWVVKRKTAKDRFARALQSLAHWCRTHRHLPIPEQWESLNSKLRGHFAYYGITGNARCLAGFRNQAERVWQKWLSRRSDRAHIPWDRFALIKERYPLPRVMMRNALRIT